MILYKKIKVVPSNWCLDIIIGIDKDKVAKLLHKKYGASADWYRDNITPNSCSTINSTNDSETKGDRIIVICLRTRKVNVVVHELVHALWHISECIGYEMNHDSQEWQAVLYEYLYTQVMNTEYEKYDF